MSKKDKLSEVSSKAKNGLAVLLIREFTIKGISLLGQVFLFRILAPELFGTFVIISFIINLSDLLTDLGLSSAIIQNKNKLLKHDLSAVLLLRQLLAVLIFLLIFIFAPEIKHLFNNLNNNSIIMIRGYSLIILLRPIRSILIALLEKDLNYKAISLMDTSGIIFYQITVIILALNHFGVWSFIIAAMSKEIVEDVIAFSYEPFIPGRTFKFVNVKKMLKYGIFVQGFSIQVFLHDAISPVIVGLRFGSYQVGLLNWSYSIASVGKYVSDNYGRIAFPALSKLQDNRKLLLKFIENSETYLTIIAIYFLTLTIVMARESIFIIFTQKWISALGALYIYAFVIALNTLVAPLVSACLGLGKSRELLLISLATLLSDWIIGIFLIFSVGFIGIPISALISVILALILFIRSLNFTELYGFIIKKFYVHFFFSAIVIILSFVSENFFQYSLMHFIVKGLLISILYLVFLSIFSNKELANVFSFIKQQIRIIKI